MKKFVIFITLIFLSMPVFSDIADLEKDVEEAEKRNQPRPPATEDNQEKDNPFFDLLLELFRIVWFVNNTTTTYNDYPYAKEDFVAWAEPDDSKSEIWYNTTGIKDYWYSLEIQPLLLEGIGYGGSVALKGHLFRFFGPYMEAWSHVDGEDFQGGARLGLLFSIIQSDPLNLSLYGQWNTWFGTINRGGGTLGLEFRSYPFQPLTLQARAGFQLFSAFKVAELEVQAGVMFNRFETFFGWRSWDLQTTWGDSVETYQGPFGGLRVYF